MIELRGLTKRFDATHGIYDVSFQVEPGMIFGFIGPNGAGKSTAIRHIMGLLRADSGHVSVFGFDSWTQASRVKANISYLPGEINYPQEMTGEAIIELTRRLFKTSHDRETRLREQFPFDASLKVRKMSKGMKQKLAIVTCFMKDVPAYVLDEPSSGLDPLMQERLVEWLIEEKAANKAILMSSHHFPEMEKTCDRAALIRDGKIIVEAEMDELKRLSQKQYDVTLHDEATAKRIAATFGTAVGRTVRITVSDEQELNAMLRHLAQFEIVSLNSGTDELEHLFLQYYGEATS